MSDDAHDDPDKGPAIPRTKTGRPPKENPTTVQMSVRCTAEDLQRWTVAADWMGVGVSTWLRIIANQATKGKTQP